MTTETLTAAPATETTVTPAAAPEVVASPVSTPVETPAAAPAPTAEPAPPAPVESLLGGPEKAGEPPAAGTDLAATEQAAEPLPPPIYEPYQLPETLTVTDPTRYAERVSAFDTKIAMLEQKYGVDHDAAAAFRQEVLSMGMEEITRAVSQSQQASITARQDTEKLFATKQAEQRQQWRDAFEASDLAGPRRQQTLDRAEQAIREYAGPDEASFRQALQDTGLANHPAMIRLLSNAAAATSEGSPVPALKASPAPASKAAKLYGK